MPEVVYDCLDPKGPVRMALNILSTRLYLTKPGPYGPPPKSVLPIDAVLGIAVGGCVEAIGTDRLGMFRRRAHAHTDPTDVWRGWICIRSVKRVLTRTGQPSRLLCHEVAHLLAPSDHGHGERWQRAVWALGAHSEATTYSARQAERARRKREAA